MTLRPQTYGAAACFGRAQAPVVEAVESRVLMSATEATVVGRYAFYNNSAFDGFNAARNAADDAAVASDKRALLPGYRASFINYTSYAKGLNGVMVDLAGLTATQRAGLGVEDFRFELATGPGLLALRNAPAPTGILVRAGAGAGGSTRVSFTFADGSVRNTWLRMTVRATPDTGLGRDDVFYFGNAVAESGDSADDAMVTGADEAAARANPTGAATVTDRFDYNRDRRVNATDQLLARRGVTTASTALKLLAFDGPRFVNPATGNDAGDGLTSTTAWRTVGRLNAALRLADNHITGVYLDTSAAPLELDQPILIHPNASGPSAARPFELTSAHWALGRKADVRGFKVLSAPYVRPDAARYPHVWTTRDNEPDTVLWEDRKWMSAVAGMSYTGPARVFDPVLNQTRTFPTVPDALQAVPGSFWNSGVELYFHPFGSTDPNVDGKVYERSRYQWAHTAISSSSGIVLGHVASRTPVANVFVHHLKVGGTTLAQAGNGASQGAYVIGGGTAGVSRIEDCEFYYGGAHIWCHTFDAPNADVTLRRVTVEQATPYADAFPLTSYAAGATGVRHTFHNVVNRKVRGSIGSAAGAGNHYDATYFAHGSGEISLTFDGCQFAEQIDLAELTFPTVRVTNSTLPTARARTGARVGEMAFDNCTITWQMPHSWVSTASVAVRNSRVTHTAHLNTPQAVRGRMTVENSVVDLTGAPGLGWSTARMMDAAADGFVSVRFTGNTFIAPGGAAVWGTLLPGQVAAWNDNVYRMPPATPIVRRYDGSPRTLPQWQALGFDTRSRFE